MDARKDLNAILKRLCGDTESSEEEVLVDIDKFLNGIEQLQAENKRLREALSDIIAEAGPRNTYGVKLLRVARIKKQAEQALKQE